MVHACMGIRTFHWFSTASIFAAARNPPSPHLRLKPRHLGIFTTNCRMEEKKREEEGSSMEDVFRREPGYYEMQRLTNSNSSDGWDKCWDQGLTPWDLGQPTPVVLHLHQTEALPKGRALVPGCGSGYDVVAIACPERYVVGLDISEKAVLKARELTSSLPNANHFTFLKADFFMWQPPELFDLILDYTFFCAIQPKLRPLWAQRIGNLLKTDGELITLIYPISDHEGGPPYRVSVSDYEDVLHPLGFRAVSVSDNQLAVQPRKGKEKLGRWKRNFNQLPL